MTALAAPTTPHFLAAPLGFGDATSDLAAFDTSVSAGDTYINAGEWQSAVTAYQAAGNAGVTVVGPEIDTLTGGVSQPVTQQAWAINGNLAAVNNSSSTQSDATNAQGFVRQIQNLYHQAIMLQAFAPGATPSSGLQSMANNLLSYLKTNGCTQSAFSQCSDFQTAYNAEGQSLLTVDGEYGPLTQAALQRVLNTSTSPPRAAPANCFSSASSSRSLSVPTTTIIGKPETNWTPWIIGGAAALGLGAIGYAYHKKHKRGRR